MSLKNKVYILLLFFCLISESFSKSESYSATSHILKPFYEGTNIIIKYNCNKGSRSFIMKAVTLDCEPQSNNFQEFETCSEGQYEFASEFYISCNDNQTLLTSNAKFKPCKVFENKKLASNNDKEIEKIKEGANTSKTVISKRDVALQTTTNLILKTYLSTSSAKPSSPSSQTTFITTPGTTTKQHDKKMFTMSAPMQSIYLIWIQQNGEGSNQDSWQIDYHTPHGYLLPNIWPLLIFYQLSLSLYVFFLVAWLVLCCIYRKDLLQVHYYIGFVILLGLIEKVIFVAEYEAVNRTGVSDYNGVVFGELVSALKRTAARILVLVVSVGFGIVIPRLGRNIYYLVAIALVYFPFACIEGVYSRKNTIVLKKGWLLVVSLVLVVVDTCICYWMLSSLMQIMRKLRLRRNAVKLSVYRHFTNTLIFTMLAAVLYMIWFIIAFQRHDCNKNWHMRWIDYAFWPSLFQLILLLIIILWRPSPTNNRYSYSPLADDIEDDEAQEPMINEAFDGVKNRSKSESNTTRKNSADETLKWVDENIPKAADTLATKMLDSDEDVENTLFELNKMQ